MIMSSDDDNSGDYNVRKTTADERTHTRRIVAWLYWFDDNENSDNNQDFCVLNIK